MDTALAALSEGIALLDEKTKTILFANESFAKMLGKERIFVLGVKIGDILRLASSSGVPLAHADLPWSRERRKSKQQAQDYLIDSPQGQRHLEIVVSRFDWKDEKGKPVKHLILVQRDITWRNKAETAILESGEKFRLLVQEVLDYAIFMLDPKGQIKSWNVGAERLFGYKAENVIEHHFSLFYRPEDIQAGKPAQELAVAASQGRIEDEGWRQRQDGQRFWANTVITAIKDEKGSLRGYAKITRDMSERRQAQQALIAAKVKAETSNKELESFSYAVAHDLRAPLRKILGFSQALEKELGGKFGEAGHSYLLRIQNNVFHLDALIESLLRLSRITRQEPRRETVDLSNLAKTIMEESQKARPERQADTVIEPGITVQGDSDLLQIALQNLLDNAWKFTAKHPRCRIEFGVRQEKGERVYFVRDDGAGFDMAHAKGLFSPFKRLHASGEFPGTGIGLATVQRIIQRHGGRLWVEAAPERGATFFFTLRGGGGGDF